MSETNFLKVVHPFNRDNLFYEVRYPSFPTSPPSLLTLLTHLKQVRYASNPDSTTQMEDVLQYIRTLHRRRGRPSSGIIYCRTRATCDALTGYLRGKGLQSKAYHRGIACVFP
jgi:superfamily II DNA helicase RecQ